MPKFNANLHKNGGIFSYCAEGDTAVVADRLGAGFMFWKLVVDRRLVFSYAEIIGLDVKLWRGLYSID